MANSLHSFIRIDGIQGDSTNLRYPNPWFKVRFFNVGLDLDNPLMGQLLEFALPTRPLITGTLWVAANSVPPPIFGRATAVTADWMGEKSRLVMMNVILLYGGQTYKYDKTLGDWLFSIKRV